MFDLAAIAIIALPALQTALEALVKRAPEGDSAWFDELEADLIREAKSTIVEGLPIEIEAASLKAGIQVLQTTINAARPTDNA